MRPPRQAPPPARRVPAARSGSAWAALRHRQFRIYFLGQSVSLVGTWMQQVAQGWVVVTLAASATTLGLVQFVFSLPMLALWLPAGLLVDRGDRRRILMASQAGLMLLAFGYAALVGRGALRLEHVYLFALGLGVVSAFDFPAAHALVPSLVPPEEIADAVALNQAAFHGARLVGPALAGVVIRALGPASAFVGNGLSFLAVLASLTLLRPTPAAPAPHPAQGQLLEGLRYVRARKELLALLGLTGLTTTFVFPFLVVLMPLLVKRVLGAGADALGLIMAGSGLGAMAGALALLGVRAEARRRRILAAVVGIGGAMAVVSLLHDPLAVAAAVTVLSFCVATALGLGTTILQISVPDRLRGRVMSTQTLLFTGLMPSAALALGAVVDRVGMARVLLGSALAYVAIAVPWLLRAGFAGAQDTYTH